MRKLIVICVLLAAGFTPMAADAQSRPTLQNLQTENAKLKRTVSALQKRIAVLSSIQKRLAALERSAKRPSGDSSAVRSRLEKLEAVLRITGKNVRIKSGGVLILEGSGSVSLLAGGNLTVDGGGVTVIKGGVVRLGGSGGKPIARVGDSIVSSPVGGPGRITQGSALVFSR